MYKVKALVKKTMGLLLATLVAFGVTAGTTQAFAGGRAATGKKNAIEKNDKTATKRDSQLTTNSSENQSSYEYTDAGVQEPYMKDAEIHVYSVKDDNGKAAADINITYKNAKDFCSQFLGVREYTATAKEGWVFKNWTYKQLFNGKDYGNYGISFRSFSQDHDHKTTPYTSGEKISVNRTGSIFETAFKKRIYKVYANLNPTIKATAGVGGSITSDGEVISTTRDGRTEVPYGVSRKYTFTAQKGYVIDSLKVDGVDQKVEHKASGSYEFQPVKSPHKIEVSFAKAYTVTYTDGVDNEEIFKDQVTSDILSGTDTPKFNGTPSREGYEFTGWNPAVAKKVTDNATYAAQWKRIQRTVTFMDGDKTHATVKVETGKAIDKSMPKNPTKAGFTFNEWNTKENGNGQTFTGTSVVNSDMTVYAVYTPAPTPTPTPTPQPKQPPTPPTAPQPKQPSTPQPPEPKVPSSKPEPKTPDPKPQHVSPVQHDNSEPAVLDTQEAEVLHGKMKYEADDTLPYNTQKKIKDPVDGLKITTHTGSFVNGQWVPSDKVEITPAKDGLTKVGNKQVTHEGNKTITTTYDVDPDTGELTNPKKHISMPMASSIDSSANGDGSTSGSDALQPVGTRSADALPNTGSNASGITFAFFGAMVFGMFAASGAAANCKRAKHLR